MYWLIYKTNDIYCRLTYLVHLSIFDKYRETGFSYDDNGNRIYKEFGTTKEFYLRDHTGQELALFKVSGSADTLMFYHIYGLGLEGRAEQTWSWNYETEPPQIERSEEPIYYIKDHLGTIRVTINKQGTILFAADYWPYGEKMAEY
ncbi:MAG: hypothetical protein L6Q47_02555 [Ignavibacteriaceae bacterium]|nr:hypothetical protein [Ignavibacteriaceae bacterium]